MKTFEEIIDELGKEMPFVTMYAMPEDVKKAMSHELVNLSAKKYAEQAAMKVLEDIAFEINKHDSPVVRDLNKFILEYKIVLP